MVKNILKFALCVLVYLAINMVISSVLPYSQGFMELRKDGTSISLLFLVIFAAWVCYAMYFTARHADINGKKLYLVLVCVTFLIVSLMTQIETVLFGSAFPALTRVDVLWLLFAFLVSIAATALPVTLFFQNKNTVYVKWEINLKSLLIKLGIIGVIYFCLYFLFGYFVAWQFSELRTFYTNSSVNDITQSSAQTILNSQVALFFVQVIRGIMFGVFIIPLRRIIHNKAAFIISVCLVYLGTGMQLIVPNPLFPDIVRYAHLIEMTGSMLLFGLAAGFIMWGKKAKPV